MEILVEQLEEQLVAVISTTTSQQEIGTKVGENFGKIIQYLGKQQQNPIGAPFVAYYSLDPENLQVDFGFPVAEALPETNIIKLKKTPAGKVVTCIHKGSYTTLGETYETMTTYMQKENIEPTMIAYEYYLNNVTEVPEEALLTKVVLYTK